MGGERNSLPDHISTALAAILHLEYNRTMPWPVQFTGAFGGSSPIRGDVRDYTRLLADIAGVEDLIFLVQTQESVNGPNRQAQGIRQLPP